MNSLKPQDPDAIQGALEEFKSLRAEIHLRIGLRSRLIVLCISLFGVIATLSSKGIAPIEILMLYPLLAMFIAFEWSYHDLRIFAVADYIKRTLEPVVPGLHWQHHLDETRQFRKLRVAAVSAGGIFVAASFISMAMAAQEFGPIFDKYGYAWIVFAVVDLASIAGSIYVVLMIRRVDTETHKESDIIESVTSRFGL